MKLQRNALSVIEAPTGNEEDDDLDFETVQWNGSDMGEFGCDAKQIEGFEPANTISSLHVLICFSKVV